MFDTNCSPTPVMSLQILRIDNHPARYAPGVPIGWFDGLGSVAIELVMFCYDWGIGPSPVRWPVDGHDDDVIVPEYYLERRRGPDCCPSLPGVLEIEVVDPIGRGSDHRLETIRV